MKLRDINWTYVATATVSAAAIYTIGRLVIEAILIQVTPWR